MATKKKKVRSHVKRVKLQQKKNPVSQEKYEKRLKVARKKDFFRRLRNVILILAIAFCALFAAGNLMLKKATGQTLIGCMREAKDLVDSSTPDTFRLAQTSYIYSDDGTQLAALAESEDATYLGYEDIPADVHPDCGRTSQSQVQQNKIRHAGFNQCPELLLSHSSTYYLRIGNFMAENLFRPFQLQLDIFNDDYFKFFVFHISFFR